MEARLAPLYDIFKLNSRLFLNCLDGMNDDQASWRAGDGLSSAAFIAMHLVDTRHGLAAKLGLELDNPFAEIKGRKSVVEMRNVPGLDGTREAWKAVTGELRQRFAQLTEADLGKDSGTKLGIDDKSMLGYIGFLMQHDSYHIGQLGLLRRQLGLPAMSYR